MTRDGAATIRRADESGALAGAAAWVRAGGLVAFPTETVYGVGADATDAEAVARIFEAKGRPRFNPLIVHCADAGEAAGYAAMPPRARTLAEHFWPGPLTLVLRRHPDSALARLVSAGLDTVALRVPGHAVARALIRESGRPVAAPSANRSGQVSPTTAAHVADSLNGRVDFILDGGACSVGVESTVVDVTHDPPVLLRPGGVAREDLEATVGPITTPGTDPDAPASPGQLHSHYAPSARVRLDADTVAPDEGLLAFGPEVPGGAGAVYNLSPSGDLREAAANLFAGLRTLDAADVRGIAVMPIPERGLGLAINDRLRRAAAPRSPDSGDA